LFPYTTLFRSGLLQEEQGGGAAPEVWTRASDRKPPGCRRDGSDRCHQAVRADQLHVMPPAAFVSATRSAGEGPGQQPCFLCHLSQGSDEKVVCMRRMNTMSEVKASLIRSRKGRLVLCLMLGLTLLAPISAFAGKKKKKATEPAKIPVIDYSNIVWPNPPAIARIRYQAYY